MKGSLRPDGYLWRKYHTAIPVHCPRPPHLPEDGVYHLWPAEDDGARPDLNRWDGLEDAFLGYCSRGTEVLCVCYDMQRALAALLGKGFYRTFNKGSDAAELREFFRDNFLGVYFGDRTPFFFSASPDWENEMRLFASSIS